MVRPPIYVSQITRLQGQETKREEKSQRSSDIVSSISGRSENQETAGRKLHAFLNATLDIRLPAHFSADR